jgi:hydroxyacylglutathione hydrolase
MNLVALPAFSDNYIWMLHDGSQALVVDPGDAAPVIAALDASRLTLSGILVTHHHPDHVGGIAGLRSRLQGQVHGPARETIPAPFEPHGAGDVVAWCGLSLQVLDVPGHTAGHIAWFVPATAGQAPLLFCGDTLFSGGCGRLFEGTAAQMQASLQLLSGLPGDTRVCCAHEYTLGNLSFGLAVEPDNLALQQHRAHCEQLRARNQPTLPSRIAREREINPFLRCDQPQVQAAAQRRGADPHDPVSVLATLREWKNQYR